MRLPRWTVYPALAVIAIFLVTAIPTRRPAVDPETGTRLPESTHERLVVLGIDGMDPVLLAEVIEKYPERMSNFRRLIDEGGLHPLGTSNPPQSPVAWSNFITGLNPGAHGIFDFIPRDPVTRTPGSTTSTSEPGGRIGLPGDWKFPIGGSSENRRTGESFWVTLAKHGVPADIWRMPANFPVEPSKGLSFPGMLTPALDSAYGEFTLYTTDPPLDMDVTGGRIVPVRPFRGVATAPIIGPPNAFKDGDPSISAELRFHIDEDSNAVAIEAGARTIVLEAGQWSDFVQVDFPVLPLGANTISGVVRFYLRSVTPQFELYASPVNIDPLRPAAPVSEPVTASADVADVIGIYYTQGMAEEVNALKVKVLTDAEFMDQSQLVYDERVRMMDYALDRYTRSTEGGFLFFYYSTIDLCCHMMWRHADEEHPHHDADFADQDSSAWSGREGSTWKDIVHDLYLRMDPVLGHLRERIGLDTPLIVMSDHGFAPYRRKFSLNAWLHANGYLVLKEGRAPELPKGHPSRRSVYIWDAVDWPKTRAYGMGFNGLYLNLAGREGDMPHTEDVDESGIVQPGAEADALLAELVAKLEAIEDEENGGTRVILRAALASEAYSGPRLGEAPDILVGYNSGYGNSDASSLGRVPNRILEDNLGGTFNGNHLMDPSVVPGILLSNVRIPDGDHDLEDLTVEILTRYAIEPGEGLEGRPIFNR